MERNREGRRGGNGSGNVSSLSRRPRTSSGFKDVSEDEMADENQNSRLQPRKDGLSSRKRRKRRGSQEAAPQQQQQGRAVEMEECFDDAAEMAGSEDDDDLPPPTIRRRTGKLKINLKGHDDASSIDMAVVPRKLRTAMIKRYRDSTPPPPPPNAEILRQVSNVDGAVVATRTPPASSNAAAAAALKPGRRTKPNNLKPRSAKLPKISPSTISEQEAEVAETLYDLARMFSSQPMSLIPEAKTEADLEIKSGPACVSSAPASAMPSTIALPHSPISSSPSPPAGSGLAQSAASASSPSSTHTLGALGAPKRKRPRISSKSKDAGQLVGATQLAVTANLCLSTATLGVTTESVDVKQVVCTSFDRNQLQVENNTSPTTAPLAESMVASTAGSPSTSTNVLASPVPSHMPQAPDDSMIPEDKVPIAKVNNHGSVEVGTSTSVLVEYKATVANLVDSRSVADKGGGSVESSVVSETLALPEFANRLQQLSPVKSDCPSKFEIDLMAPPNSRDKTGDTLGSSMVDVKEKKEADLATIPAVENSTLDVGSEENDLTNIHSGREDRQIIAKVENDQCKGLESNKNIEQLGETDDRSVYLKDGAKQEGAKQSAKGAATTIKTTAANGVPNRALPISMGMTGWPGGLPPLGYYSPAAAAVAAAGWPVPVPMTGTSSVGENNTTRQLPSLFLHTQQCWKRCATHVYITHFINSQQHVKHNPLLAAAYGDPTGFYGAKAYNINIPMVPADAIFGNSTGSDLMGTSVSSALEPVIRGPALGVGSLNMRGYGVAPVAAANELGPKDKANSYIDVPGRKPPLQQKTETAHPQPGLSLQGCATAFGFPVTQSASVSAVGANAAGDNVGVSAAMLSGGSSTSLNSSSVDVENSQSNGSVANAAAVQAQLLHSVIQHPPFPFSFPPGQFGPIFSGHISSQQAAQYYSNNSFYGPHLTQPPPHGQQSQQASNFTPEASVSQRQQQQQQQQQQQHSQDISSFVSSGSAHQQHQQVVGTPGGALQHLDCVVKKEHVIVHGTSAAEMKPSVHISIYGQNSPSLQALSGNFQSSILAAGKPALPVNDLSAIAALGGKQAGKMHQQQVHSLLPSQHQSTINLQQQHVSTQNHASSPALQISLKDTSASQMPATSAGLNKGSDASLGLPAITSVMASPGHALFQNVGDTLRGLGQYHISPHNPLVSGQPHQFSVPGTQHQQQHSSQMQRAVSSGVENGKTSLEESSYSSGGHREDRKSGGKHQLNQSNIGRVELEASANIQSSPTNDTSSLTSNTGLHINMMVPNSQGGTSMAFGVSLPTQQCNQSSKQQIVRYKAASSSNLSSAPTPAPAESTFVTFTDRMPPHPAAYCKIPPGQVLPFPGHTVALGNQGVKQGRTSQQIPQVKTPQQSAVGSPLPASSASLPQAMLAAMAKTHGQQSRSRQSATNAVPVSRLSPATSVSSPSATSLSPLLPASKAGGAATAKNALFVKDSYSLPQKSSSGATSGKKVSSPTIPPNVASVLGSSPLAHNVPLKSSHAQLIQNQYNIQQQHPSYPLFHQAVQPMVSAHQQPTVPQQYHLQQSPSTQQQALQLHKIFMQQNPQYVQTQSQLQSQVQAQQSTMHLRQTTHQSKQQCGQMSAQSQQPGSAQRQHLEHPQQHQPIQSAPLTSFGIPANGVLAPTLSLGTVNAGVTGNVPRSVISDGAMISQSTTLRPSTPVKLTTNDSNASPGFQRSNATGPTLVLNQYGPSNSATSSQQQIISTNSSVSISYPNSASQLVSNSDTTGKLGDKQPTADIPIQSIKKTSAARKAS